jgi:hypothetical protein
MSARDTAEAIIRIEEAVKRIELNQADLKKMLEQLVAQSRSPLGDGSGVR